MPVPPTDLPQPETRITNIIAKTQLVHPFTLSSLESKHPFDHSDNYNAKLVFHGARIFIPHEHIKFSVFRTGTVLSRAARSFNELDESFSWLSSFLADFNLKLCDEYEILNIVAFSRLPFSFNLYELATHLLSSSYDSSPSLSEEGYEHLVNCITFYFRETKPRYTALIFPTGRVTLTGFKSVAELELHISKLSELVSEIAVNHPEVLSDQKK